MGKFTGDEHAANALPSILHSGVPIPEPESKALKPKVADVADVGFAGLEEIVTCGFV